jgi:AraC-like DNA-binding protein/mannose-6-phosphate isomerase-like protein (cupin superfamily)
MPGTSPRFNYDEDVPRPVVATGHDYPPSFELDRHHLRNQLIYAEKGVAVVSTPQGAWAAPSERAVWIPAGVPHSVRMVGAVSTRSVLIQAQVVKPGDRCQVVGVSPLLRQLLVAAAAAPAEYDETGRDGLVMSLLIKELEQAPLIPLSAPFPRSPALAAKCHAFLERPSPHDTIDGWAEDLGMGRRAFTRAFRRETGMSFAEWRQPVCWWPCRAWRRASRSRPSRSILAMTAPPPSPPCSSACPACRRAATNPRP